MYRVCNSEGVIRFSIFQNGQGIKDKIFGILNFMQDLTRAMLMAREETSAQIGSMVVESG